MYVRGITNEENVYLCDFETTRMRLIRLLIQEIKNKYKTKLQLKLDLTYLLDIPQKINKEMALTPEELAKLALETELATIQLKEQAKIRAELSNSLDGYIKGIKDLKAIQDTIKYNEEKY
jgi:hypothetical protein